MSQSPSSNPHQTPPPNGTDTTPTPAPPSPPGGTPAGAPSGIFQRLAAGNRAYNEADAEGRKDLVRQFLRRYAVKIVGGCFVLWLVAEAPQVMVTLLTLVLMVCLFVGIRNPESFRSLFKERTSKPVVGWTFGGLLLLCGVIGSSLPPPTAPPPANHRKTPVPVVSPPQRTIQDTQAQAEQRARRAEAKEKASAQAKAQAEERARLAEARAAQAERRATEAGREARAAHNNDQVQMPPDSGSTTQPQEPEKDLFGVVSINPKVDKSPTGITIANADSYDWTEVKLSLNPTFGISGGYEYTLPALDSQESAVIPYSEFAKRGGERFNSETMKPLSLKVMCKTKFGNGMAKFE